MKSQVLIHHRAPIILLDVKEHDVELIYQSSKYTSLMNMSGVVIDGAFKAVDFHILMENSDQSCQTTRANASLP